MIGRANFGARRGAADATSDWPSVIQEGSKGADFESPFPVEEDKGQFLMIQSPQNDSQVADGDSNLHPVQDDQARGSLSVPGSHSQNKRANFKQSYQVNMEPARSQLYNG